MFDKQPFKEDLSLEMSDSDRLRVKAMLQKMSIENIRALVKEIEDELSKHNKI